MNDVVGVSLGFMYQGQHGYNIVLWWLQFGRWYEKPMGRKEELSSDEPVDCKKGVVQILMSKGVMRPLWYTRAPENCTSDPRSKRIGHNNRNEIEVHFWRNDLLHPGVLQRYSHQTERCIPSSHPPWPKEMNNIPQWERFEVVYIWNVATREKCFIPRPE